MTVRVAIMGFGRIGRNVFRVLYRRDDMEIVAINDIADPRAMEYLLRFDSLHGRFEEPVRIIDDHLYAKGRRIPILHESRPKDTPWGKLGADIVVEATGRYRKREELEEHLEAGARRVILSTPPRNDIDAIFVHGVSERALTDHDRIISCGSSTFNCTAIMLKVLDDAFGVEEAFFTSVHAYTTEQSLIDVPSPIDLRLSRAAVENIVPVNSWTARGIPKLFPHLEGKFGGGKLNVPVPDVSCVDLVCTLPSEVSPWTINEVFRSAAGSTMKGSLDFTEMPIVSTDVLEAPASCTFDALATMVVEGNLTKTLGWYDQGGGLAHRIVEVIDALRPGRLAS